MKRLTKLLALIMVLALVLGLAPAAALAEGGHIHNWKERSRTEPTCTQAGSVTYVCSCGEKKVEQIPALGHAWNAGEIVEDESFPGGKKLHFWCWRCGVTKDEPLPADADDDYGWEPPVSEDLPAVEEVPDGEVSPASGYPSELYDVTVEVEDTTGWKYALDPVEVHVTFTNTGKKTVDVTCSADGDYLDYPRMALAGCDVGELDVSSEASVWKARLEPGQSGTVTLRVSLKMEDLDRPWIERMLPAEFTPPEASDSPASYPADWPWEAKGRALKASFKIGKADPAIQQQIFHHPAYGVGEYLRIDIRGNSLSPYVMHEWEVDVYKWDKAAGDYVFVETVQISNAHYYPKSIFPGYYWVYGEVVKLKVTDQVVAESDDGILRYALRSRSWTEDGTPVETELEPREIYVFDGTVLLEAEDTSAGQIPEDGWVKVKLTASNPSTEIMTCTDSWFFTYEFYTEYSDYDFQYDALSWLTPDSSVDAELRIKVLDEDIKAGEVRRRAYLHFWRRHDEDGMKFPADSPKESAVGPKSVDFYINTNEVEIVIPLLAPPAEPAPASERRPFCEPALNSLGDGAVEWTLTRCPDHAALAKEAEGKTPQEALALWGSALEAEYDEWLAEADESLRPLIEAERAAFEAQVAAYGAAWELRGGPDYAAEKMTELVMHKVSLLCFAREAESEDWAALFTGAEELDAAAEQPLCRRESHDSVVSLRTREALCADHRQIAPSAEDEEGWRELKTLWLAALNTETDARWLAADAENREFITAERQSFGKWLAAWEALLTARYPEDPALVQQLLTQAVRARTVDLCR